MFKKVKLYALDMDGTIWKGNELCTGALELIEFLQKNYKVVFHTNSSTKTKIAIKNKLNQFNINCNLNEIYTSASLVIDYLKENKILNDLYVIGSKDFKTELINEGLSLQSSKYAKNVIVGMDINFSYRKIKNALQVLNRKGQFIACNIDANFPIGNGKIMPGCGAMVGAIIGASGVIPYVVGKPNTYLIKKISNEFNVKYDEIVVIGDSYLSDIVMAQVIGCNFIYIGSDKSISNKCNNLLEVLQILKGENKL